MKQFLLFLFVLLSYTIFATDYNVGPNQSLATIADVPWATLQPGDRVFIHWKSTPYKEKWVINRRGTAAAPIQVIGVSNASGEQPVIDGNDAETPLDLDFFGESRGVLKIGGSSVPTDGLPAHLIIDNLEIRSGRPPYQFTDDNGNLQNYANNAAAIYVEKAEDVIIRNCTLHDSGNGLFIGAFNGQSKNFLIEGNYIYGNSIVGRFREHNAYTECINITYQYNRFGDVRSGAGGNNLKDRSAGLVVRYNWIENGNRQLDLVEPENNDELLVHPAYHTTHVYGNILLESDGNDNSQIIHYGGDNGMTNTYRKGTLYFYNNTVITTHSSNTTLIRLSTNDETAEVFNNIIYAMAGGSRLAMIDDTGVLNLNNNWLNDNWNECHCGTPSGTINSTNNLTGTIPDFNNIAMQDFTLVSGASSENAGIMIPANLLPEHDLTMEYMKHQMSTSRTQDMAIDLGAFERLMSLTLEHEKPAIEVPETIEKLIIQPNPTTDDITIQWAERDLDKVVIYSADGQIVMTTTQANISLHTLKSGMYYLQLFDQDGQMVYRRIVKL